jgi:hypothetical protein
MTTATKEAIKAAVHDLAVANKARQDAADARTAAVVALNAAQDAERAVWGTYHAAELALTESRAMGWVEDHPDDLATVRAGIDFPTLARLKLGKKGWSNEGRARFDYNDLGTAVRRILGK